jgi:hypothetical protein
LITDLAAVDGGRGTEGGGLVDPVAALLELVAQDHGGTGELRVRGGVAAL